MFNFRAVFLSYVDTEMVCLLRLLYEWVSSWYRAPWENEKEVRYKHTEYFLIPLNKL